METGHTFGTLLRRARRALGLTQEEVAARAGVSLRTISDLERGVSHAPHADTVARLAVALDLQGPDGAAFTAAAIRLRAPAALAPPVASVPSDRELAPFVGRQRELALLERHLTGQGPPVLLLAGEPGIGKTRLLRAVAPRAIGHGLAALDGGCQRRGGQEPYAPLLAALKGHPAARRRPRSAWRCGAAPGWCACCPNWRIAPSSRCRPGRSHRSRSAG